MVTAPAPVIAGQDSGEPCRPPLKRQSPIEIRPVGGFITGDLRNLPSYWELLYFLVWRDIKVRYKQTLVGVGWAVIQPLSVMLMFTLVFGKLAGFPADGAPYPIFAFAALLLWNYFSQSVSRGGASMLNNANLVTKVYFPRVILPILGVAAPMVDFAISFVLLLAMMLWFGVAPGWGILVFPLFLLGTLLLALGLALWLSAMCVRYRDVGVMIPLLLQAGLYASPVAYPARLIPERWQLLYSLNPMVGMVEGFRWALFGTALPVQSLLIGLGTTTALLVSGFIYFQRRTPLFADLA